MKLDNPDLYFCAQNVGAQEALSAESMSKGSDSSHNWLYVVFGTF